MGLLDVLKCLNRLNPNTSLIASCNIEMQKNKVKSKSPKLVNLPVSGPQVPSALDVLNSILTLLTSPFSFDMVAKRQS